MNAAAADPVHLLLVDDLQENLTALEGLLRREGLVLLQARSGPDALEFLLKHDVALALVDVQMPGMDGFELAELMRGSDRTRRVPIIFITAGIADRQRRFRGYEAGAVDFLHKPIDPDILKSKVEVFVELYLQRREVARHRDDLQAAIGENQRLLKESRRYADALKDADRRKDEFLATLAHELRNPLAPIRSGLHIMKLSPSDTEAVARARDMMDWQLTHMVRLVDDLLDVSRISRGKVELRREPVSVASVVEAALETSRPLAEAARHELVVNLPEEELPLLADPTRIAQVLSNLLNNAVKYTPEGGHIELSVIREGEEVVLTVRDDGAGIPREMLPKVFDLFTQVDRTIDRAQGGLGIGLSLVKQLVELHGGTISAASGGLGKGSSFTVRLPLAERDSVDPMPCPPTLDEPNGEAHVRCRRILVVDDNIDGAESLSLMLRLSGHETRSAHTGDRAIEIAREFAPEVVFLDIGLPGKNGYEVAEQLRTEASSKDAMLVALTGWGADEDKQRSREAGFDFHLTKPIELDVVEKLLSEAPPHRGNNG